MKTTKKHFCLDYDLIAPFMRVKECGGNEYLKLFPEVLISGFWMVLTVSLPKSFTALISGPFTSKTLNLFPNRPS
jgi:hypothetical protein